MKKLFFLINIICIHTIFYCSENNTKNTLYFKTHEGHNHVSSLQAFIQNIFTWNKIGNQYASIESYNDETKKELTITFFHAKDNTQKNNPCKVTYCLDNNEKQKNFNESSIWSNLPVTEKQIFQLFQKERNTASDPAIQYLNHIEQILHCTTNSHVYFEPIIHSRIVQKIDTFVQDNPKFIEELKKLNKDDLPKEIKTNRIPQRRQRENISGKKDYIKLPEITISSPSPNKPCHY